MYQACIFDMDGTVLDTLHSIAAIGNRALAALELPPIPADRYRQLVGNGADTLMRRMLRAAGATETPDLLHRLRRIYDGIYTADPYQLVRPYPGVLTGLHTLQTQGVRLAVLSNKPDDIARLLADKFFPDVFDLVRGQQSGVPIKPDPTALRLLCNSLHCAPQDVLYCGDSGVDMQTGCRAGCFTAGVLWGFRDRDELLAEGAMRLFKNMDELVAFALQE